MKLHFLGFVVHMAMTLGLIIWDTSTISLVLSEQAVYTIRSHVLAYDRGELDSQIMLDRVSPLIMQCFQDIESYCEERLTRLEIDKTHFSHSFFAVQDYDYKSVVEVVHTHQRKFINDPHAYIDQYIVDYHRKL